MDIFHGNVHKWLPDGDHPLFHHICNLPLLSKKNPISTVFYESSCTKVNRNILHTFGINSCSDTPPPPTALYGNSISDLKSPVRMRSIIYKHLLRPVRSTQYPTYYRLGYTPLQHTIILVKMSYIIWKCTPQTTGKPTDSSSLTCGRKPRLPLCDYWVLRW